MNHRDRGLYMIAGCWERLGAWRPVDCRGLHLAVRHRDAPYSTGRARGDGRVVVTLGTDAADGLATLLHELAHVAALRQGHDGHGEGWQKIYRAAAEEVLKEPVSGGYGSLRLTRVVRDAFATAWNLRGTLVNERDDGEVDDA